MFDGFGMLVIGGTYIPHRPLNSHPEKFKLDRPFLTKIIEGMAIGEESISTLSQYQLIGNPGLADFNGQLLIVAASHTNQGDAEQYH